MLPLWRSLYSLNLMLPKEDRKAMLLRLYNDNGEIFDHQKEKKNQEQAERNSAAQRLSDASAPNAGDIVPAKDLQVNQRAADLEEVSSNGRPTLTCLHTG